MKAELTRRADRLFARRLKQAGIVTMKTLADFDWALNAKLPKPKLVELATACFVQTHAGVLLIGPPGVGKSHMATALAVGAIRAGHRVLIRSTFVLVADFAEAEATVFEDEQIDPGEVLHAIPPRCRPGAPPQASPARPLSGSLGEMPSLLSSSRRRRA